MFQSNSGAQEQGTSRSLGGRQQMRGSGGISQSGSTMDRGVYGIGSSGMGGGYSMGGYGMGMGMGMGMFPLMSGMLGNGIVATILSAVHSRLTYMCIWPT